MSAPGRRIVVKRTHGLGNVLLLLPVLTGLAKLGERVTLVTREEWADCLGVLFPQVRFVSSSPEHGLDLDSLTKEERPRVHRTEEFGALMGIPGPFPRVAPRVPELWRRAFRRDGPRVVLAPEASHAARRMPDATLQALAPALRDRGLTLTGLDPAPPVPWGEDLRGRLSVQQLIGVISVAECVVSMDSAALHVATLLGVPAVAIFGGVDPRYRVLPGDRVISLVSEIACQPCNKNETCDGRFDCLQRIPAGEIVRAVDEAAGVGGSTVRRV